MQSLQFLAPMLCLKRECWKIECGVSSACQTWEFSNRVLSAADQANLSVPLSDLDLPQLMPIRCVACVPSCLSASVTRIPAASSVRFFSTSVRRSASNFTSCHARDQTKRNAAVQKVWAIFLFIYRLPARHLILPGITRGKPALPSLSCSFVLKFLRGSLWTSFSHHFFICVVCR